jgi:hypothetical protein
LGEDEPHPPELTGGLGEDEPHPPELTGGLGDDDPHPPELTRDPDDPQPPLWGFLTCCPVPQVLPTNVSPSTWLACSAAERRDFIASPASDGEALNPSIISAFCPWGVIASFSRAVPTGPEIGEPDGLMLSIFISPSKMMILGL